MATYYLARILLAYASFGTTEDGRECLEWDIPDSINGSEDIRVVLENGEAVLTESRKCENGVWTDWQVSCSSGSKPMTQTINECLSLIDALGMSVYSIVGIGFNSESREEIEEEIPKRRIQRG